MEKEAKKIKSKFKSFDDIKEFVRSKIFTLNSGLDVNMK